jgi:glycosyltransferase involved in cell wall biosynthesis
MGPGRADLDAKVVVAAGRLSPQKGFDLLVRAWAHVHETHPDWRLRIYGDGPRRAGLGRRIERLGLGDVVTLEGPSPDLGAELARASTFVLSSRFEGLPLVLLEAMSLGMAVVSFDCPTGPRDVVADRRNGLLVPPERIKALAAALVEVMDDPALRRTLAAGAVQTAADYRMEAIGPQWDALLTRPPS